MAEATHIIYVSPEESTSTINTVIRLSTPRATIIFEQGTYAMDGTLYFLRGRNYIVNGCRFTEKSPFTGPYIKQESEPTLTRKERFMRSFRRKVLRQHIYEDTSIITNNWFDSHSVKRNLSNDWSITFGGESAAIDISTE